MAKETATSRDREIHNQAGKLADPGRRISIGGESMRGGGVVNIDEMPAGREMDALVGEKIIGKKFLRAEHKFYCGRYLFFDQKETWSKYQKQQFETGNYAAWEYYGPYYSTNITAAFEVFTHWGWQGKIGFSGLDWFCEIQTEITGDYYFETRDADSGALAICRAALKAVVASL